MRGSDRLRHARRTTAGAQFLARQRGKNTVTSRDYDVTDYEALRRFVLDFATRYCRASAAV